MATQPIGKLEKHETIHPAACANCGEQSRDCTPKGVELYVINNGPETIKEYRCSLGKECSVPRELQNRKYTPKL